MKIGFIGLGIMGKPMAKNLIKAGYDLTVYDLNADAMNEVAACGCKKAESIHDAAAVADVLITMVPNSPQVKQVLLAEGGAIETLRRGAVVIDCSSINPIASREVAAALAEKGIEMLDAPVSGGEPKAIDGTLAFMVGGKQEVFDQYKEILSHMGSSMVLCGGIGAGNVTKLCNQIIVAVNIAAVSEALMLGQSAGVEPEKIFEAIKGGLAGSTVMNAKAPMMLDQNFKPGFRLDLHIKDLNNSLETGHALGSPMPIASVVMDMMKYMSANGHGAEDHSTLMQYYEQIAGVEIVSEA